MLKFRTTGKPESLRSWKFMNVSASGVHDASALTLVRTSNCCCEIPLKQHEANMNEKAYPHLFDLNELENPLPRDDTAAKGPSAQVDSKWYRCMLWTSSRVGHLTLLLSEFR